MDSGQKYQRHLGTFNFNLISNEDGEHSVDNMEKERQRETYLTIWCEQMTERAWEL